MDDSITQQLFFLLNTFRGAEIELAEVERVVDDGEFLPTWDSEGPSSWPRGRTRRPKSVNAALYRLMLLGVVEDYLGRIGVCRESCECFVYRDSRCAGCVRQTD